MKKNSLLVLIIMLFVINAFSQSKTDTIFDITYKIIKAYKTQNSDLLSSYSSFYAKSEVKEKDYWKKDDVKKTVEIAQKWDGKIRGVGYQTMNFPGTKMENALVYLYDTPEGKIYTLQFSRKNSGNWFLSMMGGINEYDKSHFDNFKQDMDEFQKSLERAINKAKTEQKQ